MSSAPSENRTISPAKRGAREKILAAAGELARSVGAGNLSLDSVAAKAGISKGGLLYHFPSKAKLLEALVEEFLESIDRAVRERETVRTGARDRVIHAYLDVFVSERACARPPPSGLLAALGEDPDFLAPLRRFDRRLLDRIKADATDPVTALIVFLALGGLKSRRLLNIECLDSGEFDDVVARLRELIDTAPAARL